MNDFLGVSDVAERCGCHPRYVSDLLYHRKIDLSQCPVINGRRVIHKALVPKIRRLLAAKRKAQREAVPA